MISIGSLSLCEDSEDSFDSALESAGIILHSTIGVAASGSIVQESNSDVVWRYSGLCRV